MGEGELGVACGGSARWSLVWWFGGLVVWWFGGLVVWWFGGLVVWWFGGLRLRSASVVSFGG
jgi:hypothetical protein